MPNETTKYVSEKRTALHGISFNEKRWLEKVLKRVRAVREDTGSGNVHILIKKGKVEEVNMSVREEKK